MFQNRPCVVIGSNSFTGSHIVDALLERSSSPVVGISRSPEYKDIFLPYKSRKNKNNLFSFYQIDIVQQFDPLIKLLDRLKPAVVINVAALSEVSMSHEVPLEYFDTNTTAVVKLCTYLRSCSYLERYVHISSAEVFGTCGQPADEQTRFNPSTPYAVSKAAADMFLHTLIKNFKFPAIMIRSTNVYGKHQQLFKIIPRTIINLKLQQPVDLHGGGEAIKSFVHVQDVVEGILRAIERGKPGAYHFTSSNHESVAQIVQKICRWMGQDFNSLTRVTQDRIGQDHRYWLDASKAKRELGWETAINFEQGFHEVKKWIEDNWASVQQESLVYVHRKNSLPAFSV